MKVPKSLRRRLPGPKSLAKADLACFTLIFASQCYLPEPEGSGLPDVPKAEMPGAHVKDSTTDTVVEAAVRFAVEDGIAGALYLAVV